MRQWIDRFSADAGIEPPDDVTVEGLLALAATAAHASERTASPITCWVAAAAGISVARARAIADVLAADLAEDSRDTFR